MASEPEDIVEALFTNGFGEKATRLVLVDADGRDLGGWCKQAVADRLTAVTAERDRLWALLVDEARPYIALDAKDWDQPKDVLARIDAALSTINPPSGHRRPQPCSVCRREDCTTEHACE